MAKIRLFFNRRKTRDAGLDEKPIEIEVYFDNKKRMYINTGIKVEERYFDKKRNEINEKCNLRKEYNDYLTAKIDNIRKWELQAKKDGLPFTREYL